MTERAADGTFLLAENTEMVDENAERGRGGGRAGTWSMQSKGARKAITRPISMGVCWFAR